MEVTFCCVVEVVSGGGKQNLSHRFWGFGGIGRGLPNAIHQKTRSRGMNTKTAHFGRVKVGIGGRPV